MVGSETFAIVVSSTCMNDASARPRVVSAMFGGRKAFAGAGAAAAMGPSMRQVDAARVRASGLAERRRIDARCTRVETVSRDGRTGSGG
ncbi:hypothetical protein PAGU2595_014040 [Lysobacter xanthus]